MKKKKGKSRSGFFLAPAVEKYSTLILLSFTFLLYGNTLLNDFALDDGIYIQHHQEVQRGVHGIPAIFLQGSTYGFNQLGGQQPYRPIPLASFALGKSLYDNHTGIEHAINVVLYALLGLVLFQLLAYWLPSYNLLIRLSIVMLFLAHPIHTEVVANIKSRDEIFCFLFGAYSLLYLHKFIDSKNLRHWIYSGLLFFAAILSKESGLSLVLVIPLVLYTFAGRKPVDSFRILPPYLMGTTVYLVLRTLVIQPEVVEMPNDVVNNILHGAVTFSERSATTVALLGEYIRLLVVPYPLSWDYSYNHFPIVDWGSTKALGALVFHLMLAYWAIRGLGRRDVVGFCILFYALTIAITSNVFFLNGSTLGERFLFMPSWGFCMLVPILLTKWLQVDTKQWLPTKSPILLSVMSCMILLGTLLTINRNGDWKNNLSLFEAGVKAAPNSARANASLAFEYKLQAQAAPDASSSRSYIEKAQAAFARSLEIYPEFEYALYNLGVLYMEIGALDQAKIYFQDLLKAHPTHEEGLNNLGVTYFRERNYPQAISHFSRPLALNPQHYRALTNIGASHFNLNEMTKALPFYERALELQKNDSSTNDILVRIHNALGQPELADHYTALKEGLE